MHYEFFVTLTRFVAIPFDRMQTKLERPRFMGEGPKRANLRACCPVVSGIGRQFFHD
jgi:hypothetical protein